MTIRFALLTALLLGCAAGAWADGELIYPWDNPPPAPGADCFDAPCIPCVFSLPGLSSVGPGPKPCRVPTDKEAAATVAVVGSPTTEE